MNAVWPGSSFHYMQVIESPRWEDFDIKYQHKNPWAHLGMGWTLEDKAGYGHADPSPYLSLDQIDPKWMKAVMTTLPDNMRQDDAAADKVVGGKPPPSQDGFAFRG